VRSLDELARSRRGVIPPGSTLIHVGGIYHPRTMKYLLGLSRTGHPVIILHTGREEPPDYPEFEVRDGRSLFLDQINTDEKNDFRRPSKSSEKWDDIPVSSASDRVAD
jgi:hypothetical protein